MDFGCKNIIVALRTKKSASCHRPGWVAVTVLQFNFQPIFLASIDNVEFWYRFRPGVHYAERTTPKYSCNGVFMITNLFIVRLKFPQTRGSLPPDLASQSPLTDLETCKIIIHPKDVFFVVYNGK